MTLAIIASGCTKRAVMMTSTHSLGMASMDRLTVLGSTRPSRDKDALCSTYLTKIFDSTSLNKEQRQKIRTYICGGKDSISALYDFCHNLPDDLRIQLKDAFALYG